MFENKNIFIDITFYISIYGYKRKSLFYMILKLQYNKLPNFQGLPLHNFTKNQINQIEY